MRIALGIEYDGTAYNGWQRQDSGIGIQEKVERAVGQVADEVVEVVCAGRTDTGVHASGQVAHYDTGATRTLRGWLLGINSNLPDDINANWLQPVDEGFHARFSATARHYQYRILNRPVRSALYRDRAWWVHQPLDTGAMQAAADTWLGEHDFSAFRAAGCQASTPVREVRSARVTRSGDWVEFDIIANAFLQHMVRNMTGTLVAIGTGARPVEWARQLLEGRDRRLAGMAAPARGLTLVRVAYPAMYAFPV